MKETELLYELKMWTEIKDDMDYPKNDNNNGFIYGIYWLDYDSEVVEVEWFKTEQKRFDAIEQIYKINKLKEEVKK
jgi:hypothetical protein